MTNLPSTIAPGKAPKRSGRFSGGRSIERCIWRWGHHDNDGICPTGLEVAVLEMTGREGVKELLAAELGFDA